MAHGTGRLVALSISAMLGIVACQPRPTPAPEQKAAPVTATTAAPAPTPSTPAVSSSASSTSASSSSSASTAAASSSSSAASAASSSSAGSSSAAPAPVAPAPAPPVPVTPGWKLVGGDEFNGSSVDTAKWKPYFNTYGDGNNELPCLTPGNVSEGAGTLKIVSRKQQMTCPGNKTRNYTSGFLGSRETGTYYPMYAKFEARVKVPHAQGLWPAFWLRHRNGASVAEVDVLEYFHARRPGEGSAALHLDGRKNVLKKSVTFESAQAPSGWHTWGVEITPTSAGPRFEFFMDQKSYGSYVDTQHHWADVDPNATWDIAINQAVGGTPTGDPDGTLGYLPNLAQCSLGGTAPTGCRTDGINRVDWTKPAATTYEIDWVRVSTR